MQGQLQLTKGNLNQLPMQPPPPRNIIFLPPLMQPNPRNITFFISHSRTLMSTLKSKKSEMMGTGNLTKTGPRVSCFFYPMVGWCTAHASFPFISKLQLYLSSFAVTLVQEKPQQKKINIARLQNCPGNTIGLGVIIKYNIANAVRHAYLR